MMFSNKPLSQDSPEALANLFNNIDKFSENNPDLKNSLKNFYELSFKVIAGDILFSKEISDQLSVLYFDCLTNATFIIDPKAKESPIIQNPYFHPIEQSLTKVMDLLDISITLTSASVSFQWNSEPSPYTSQEVIIPNAHNAGIIKAEEEIDQQRTQIDEQYHQQLEDYYQQYEDQRQELNDIHRKHREAIEELDQQEKDLHNQLQTEETSHQAIPEDVGHECSQILFDLVNTLDSLLANKTTFEKLVVQLDYAVRTLGIKTLANDLLEYTRMLTGEGIDFEHITGILLGLINAYENYDQQELPVEKAKEIIDLALQEEKAIPGTDHTPPSQLPVGSKRKETEQPESPKGMGRNPGSPGTSILISDEVEKEEILLYPELPQGYHWISEPKMGEQRIQLEPIIGVKRLDYISMQRRAAPDVGGGGSILVRGVFPDGVKSYFSYGPGFDVLATNLVVSGLMSYERAADLIRNLFNVTITDTTIKNRVFAVGKRLEPVKDRLIEELINSPAVYGDETSGNLNGSNVWCHAVSNDLATWVSSDRHRGLEGMLKNDVLKNMKPGTILMRDRLPAYDYLDAFLSTHSEELDRDKFSNELVKFFQDLDTGDALLSVFKDLAGKDEFSQELRYVKNDEELLKMLCTTGAQSELIDIVQTILDDEKLSALLTDQGVDLELINLMQNFQLDSEVNELDEYLKFSYCTAHLLRDLEKVIQSYSRKSGMRKPVEDVADFLRETIHTVNLAKEAGEKELPKERRKQIHQQFNDLIEVALKTYPKKEATMKRKVHSKRISLACLELLKRFDEIFNYLKGNQAEPPWYGLEISSRKNPEIINELSKYIDQIDLARNLAEDEGRTLSDEECQELLTELKRLASKGYWNFKDKDVDVRYRAGKEAVMERTEANKLFTFLQKHSKEVLRFVDDFRVEPTNNIAEKALRMLVIKLKVSGYFRNKDMLDCFLLIYSILESAKKRGLNPHKFLSELLLHGNKDYLFGKAASADKKPVMETVRKNSDPSHSSIEKPDE